MLTKQERLYWKQAPGLRAAGYGDPGELPCRVARSLGFYGDGIGFRVVFGQSFYFRVFLGGTRIAQPRWMLARGILGSGWTRGVSFDLSRTLPVGGGLLVPYSLPRLPVLKQLMRMVTREPGQGRRFQSVCVP